MAVRSAFCALALGTSALTAGAVFAPSAAQAIIVWDWSVAGTGIEETSGSITGSGTFTTDGDTPSVGTTYTITDATGSFTATGLGTFLVTGLFDPPSNFQWSGESTNQLLVKLFSPDLVDLASDGGLGRRIEIVAVSFANFIVAQELQIKDSDSMSLCDGDLFGGCFYSLTSASLTPQSAPEPIPGPLPVLGAGAAFGFSRRLRRHISASQATPPQA
jgi:hypothetical protein